MPIKTIIPNARIMYPMNLPSRSKCPMRVRHLPSGSMRAFYCASTTTPFQRALGANAAHGHKRSPADKRRCVEIALREFPTMSDRTIAEICGVSPTTVGSLRPQLSKLDSSAKTIGKDGKARPARRSNAVAADEHQAQPNHDTAPKPTVPVPITRRADEIREYAERGMSTRQIARAMGARRGLLNCSA